MRIDREALYQRISRIWYHWAENHGQVPVWPPRHGSQTHHMAMAAVQVVAEESRRVEEELIEDVATFLRMQKRVASKPTKALLDALADALEDGSWENM